MLKIKVDIKFDLDKIVENYEEALQQGMGDLMNQAHGYWRDLADELHTTADVYREAVQMKQIDPYNFQVYLQQEDYRDNYVGNLVEYGGDNYASLRATLEGKRAEKFSECGAYAGKEKKNPPHVDVPIKPMGTQYARRPDICNQARADKPRFFRLTPQNRGRMVRKIKGRDFRFKVIDHIKEQVPVVFGPLLNKVTV